MLVNIFLRNLKRQKCTDAFSVCCSKQLICQKMFVFWKKLTGSQNYLNGCSQRKMKASASARQCFREHGVKTVKMPNFALNVGHRCFHLQKRDSKHVKRRLNLPPPQKKKCVLQYTMGHDFEIKQLNNKKKLTNSNAI